MNRRDFVRRALAFFALPAVAVSCAPNAPAKRPTESVAIMDDAKENIIGWREVEFDGYSYRAMSTGRIADNPDRFGFIPEDAVIHPDENGDYILFMHPSQFEQLRDMGLTQGSLF